MNLCTHRDNRQALVQILVDMLMLDLQGFSKKSIDAPEPPFRLYGCHANIAYSRPQSSDGNEVFSSFFSSFSRLIFWSFNLQCVLMYGFTLLL